MPLLSVTSSAPLDRNSAQNILGRLSKAVAEGLGKPERYVAASFSSAVSLLFGGSAEPACIAELANVGELTPGQTERLSRMLCTLLAEHVAVPADRIYVVFREVAPQHWGHSDGTFA